MTERPRQNLARDAKSLVIGPSSMRVDDDGALVVDVAEWCVPIARRLLGRVRLAPIVVNDVGVTLDGQEKHRWRPIAPLARVSVRFDAPCVNWEGSAYLDTNNGDEPLEHAFATWDWARLHGPGGCTILYDVVGRDGAHLALAHDFDCSGRMRVRDVPPLRDLPKTSWRMPRNIRALEGHSAKVVRTLEDTPFYARSLVRSDLGEGPIVGVHESLSLDRVSRAVVRCMLPFRMPRRKYGSTGTSV